MFSGSFSATPLRFSALNGVYLYTEAYVSQARLQDISADSRCLQCVRSKRLGNLESPLLMLPLESGDKLAYCVKRGTYWSQVLEFCPGLVAAFC